MQEASSGKLEDQEVGDLVNGIDPSWVLVDRIIAQQEKQGTWCSFPCVSESAVVPVHCWWLQESSINFCVLHKSSWHVGPGMQYLVKWRGLGYDECTWEAPSDLLPKFKPEIAKFKSQQPIANELVEKQKSRSQVHELPRAHHRC